MVHLIKQISSSRAGTEIVAAILASAFAFVCFRMFHVINHICHYLLSAN